MGKMFTPIILYPSKLKLLFLSIAFFVMMLVGIFIILPDIKLFGWIVIIVFSIFFIISIAHLLSNSSYLRITQEGFEIHQLLSRNTFTRWDEVDSFFCLYRQVIFKYKGKYEQKILPEQYGKSRTELVNLLNEWREKFSSKK